MGYLGTPGHSGIQQNETEDWLAREGAGSRPIGPAPFLRPIVRQLYRIGMMDCLYCEATFLYAITSKTMSFYEKCRRRLFARYKILYKKLLYTIFVECTVKEKNV